MSGSITVRRTLQSSGATAERILPPLILASCPRLPWAVDQAFSWVRGKHELKFGFNWMTTTFAFFTPPKPVGSYSFNGSYTGFGLADFLYGRPISSQIDITQYFTLTRYRPVLYVQDNWR